MSDSVRVPMSGSAIVDNDLANATAIDISQLETICLFFPTGFTAAVEVWSLDHESNYANSGITVTPPGALPTTGPTSKEISAAIFPHHMIKLKSAVADNTLEVGWKGKA